MPSFHRFILILNRCCTLFRAERTPDEELPPHLQTYILPICNTPGMSQDQLAKLMFINKSNVARHLAALEKSGYIERRQNDEDRRITNVFPTDKAFEAKTELIEGIREWNSYIMGEFSEEEAAIFYDMLSRAADRAASYAGRRFEEEEKKEDSR
ncbi:MAG: MarR family transcriptional regulator [Clostridia bacterium]|nr:MarR family transcriptional regulator [Clostridia bacterium]MBQ4327996.1 MarR family transcriptional regulator [Clostridia bacterium]